jgi:hypothetical protein
VVSNARQARQILQEVHSVRMIVGASLRARQKSSNFKILHEAPKAARSAAVLCPASVRKMPTHAE